LEDRDDSGFKFWGYIFIPLSFGKLEMHLHALESWRCFRLQVLGMYLHTPELWEAGDEPLGFRWGISSYS
jgi:hypothetical protein